MSTHYIRLYIDNELEGVASKIFDNSEYCIWIKLKLLAGKTVKREGYLEWVENMPLSNEEIATKIRQPFEIVNTTINKCLQYNLLESIRGTLHITGWENDQLSPTQRAETHKTMINGKKYSEIPQGKSLINDFKR